MRIHMILASASPRRRELLLQVGITPEIVPSQADESVDGRSPEEIVKELSRRKAESVAERLLGWENSEAVILGSDTVVSVDGRILGKPKDEAEAAEMIRLLQGRLHQVCTGVTLIFGDGTEPATFAEKTDVEIYPMTEEQIERYVATGDPMDKAGAYGIQGCFAAYVKGIRGDYNAVVGLPVGRVCQELAARGRY